MRNKNFLIYKQSRLSLLMAKLYKLAKYQVWYFRASDSLVIQFESIATPLKFTDFPGLRKLQLDILSKKRESALKGLDNKFYSSFFSDKKSTVLFENILIQKITLTIEEPCLFEAYKSAFQRSNKISSYMSFGPYFRLHFTITYLILTKISLILKLARTKMTQLMAIRRPIRSDSVVDPLSAFQPIKPDEYPNYEVIYFPHKGIYYSDHFIKDQFYIENDSRFDPRKILHVSINESLSLLRKSIEYYNKKRIPYLEVTSIPISSPKKIFRQHSLTALTHILSFRRKPLQKLYLFSILNSVTRCIGRLSQLSSAKIALIGYDCLFPGEYTLALHQLGITSVACQDRFMFPFYSLLPIRADHYFNFKKAEKGSYPIDPRFLNYEHGYHMGPWKIDHYAKAMVNDKHRERIAVGVLLIHTELSETKTNPNVLCHDGLAMFLVDVLKIAQHNKNIDFIIRSKNSTFMHIQKLRTYIEALTLLTNVKIITDYENCDSYQFGALCDATMGTHTTLMDELLYFNKPALIYDLGIYGPTPYWDYRDNENVLIAETREDFINLFPSLLTLAKQNRNNPTYPEKVLPKLHFAMQKISKTLVGA